MKEFEVKIPIEDLNNVELELVKLGAIFIGYNEERDYYIDTRPCLDLVSKDSALRLRVSKDVITGATRCELTFKGPREKHEFAKVRKEITVEVSDGEKMIEIFKMLGFNVLLAVSKRRKIYQYKDYHVYLDEVQDLGRFVEIEYLSGETPGVKPEHNLMHIVEALNLPKNFISKSYLELLLAKMGMIK